MIGPHSGGKGNVTGIYMPKVQLFRNAVTVHSPRDAQPVFADVAAEKSVATNIYHLHHGSVCVCVFAYHTDNQPELPYTSGPVIDFNDT